jgi:NAD(P)H-dependent FMN reductase
MIILITGTNRKASKSSVMARCLSLMYDEMGIENKVLELNELPPETFSPDAYIVKPPKVLEFTQDILNASGLVVVTPEYNGSMSGALKLFIDLLPFPESFEGRPVCYVGLASGQFGALRPVEHLQQVFGYRNAYNFPKRVFIPAVHDFLDDEKGILDEDLATRLKEQARSFVEFCRNLGKL